MYDFQFHRPSGLRQATNMMGKLEEAKILAGGQTLIPTMKLRLASPNNLVDLNMVEGLSGIEVKGRSIVIGAIFFLRGTAGYSPRWRGRFKVQPFRTLDFYLYSPLCLALGVGFIALLTREMH